MRHQEEFKHPPAPDKAQVLCGHIAALTGVPCHLFDPVEESKSLCDISCGMAHHCDFTAFHSGGIAEAARWGRSFVYDTPCGAMFIAIYREHGNAVITGPIRTDDDTPLGTFLTPVQVTHLEAVLRRLFADDLPADAAPGYHTGAYDIPGGEIRAVYPVSMENDLRESIVRGDVAQARAVLNRLLGYVFFSAGVDLHTIKARTLELLVLISRYAMQGGADEQRVLAMNTDCIREISQFSSLLDLSAWLVGVLNRFFDVLFEFRDARHTDTLRKITRFIEENHAEPITLDDLSAAVYLSKSYISRILRDELGTSFTAYANHIRVEHGKALLRNRRMSLSDIAVAVGFTDQSYFTRVFKSVTGMTPGLYREKYHL